MPGRSIPVTKTLGNNFADRFLRNAPGFACPKAIEVPIEVRFSVDTCRAIEVPIEVDRGPF
jgi:hypothetical protein